MTNENTTPPQEQEDAAEAGIASSALLGRGVDLAGKTVEYMGETWTIAEKNYLGFWNIERFETRSAGRWRLTSSIAPEIQHSDHPHFAKLL